MNVTQRRYAAKRVEEMEDKLVKKACVQIFGSKRKPYCWDRHAKPVARLLEDGDIKIRRKTDMIEQFDALKYSDHDSMMYAIFDGYREYCKAGHAEFEKNERRFEKAEDKIRDAIRKAIDKIMLGDSAEDVMSIINQLNEQDFTGD